MNNRDLKLVCNAFLLLASLSACSTSSAVSAVDKANIALSAPDCASALSATLPVYDSSNVTNDVRMQTAAAYGCYSGVNFFQLIYNLMTFKYSFEGSGFFRFMVMEFPSVASPDDRKPSSGEKGMDALMAVLNPGVLILEKFSINFGTENPGSLFSSDRTQDANTFLTFLSWSVMGTLLNRYGTPDTMYSPTATLPWTDPTLITSDACSVASALLNYADGLASLQSQSTGAIASTLGTIRAFLDSSLNKSCASGCSYCSALGEPVSCTNCPTTLRNRSSCTGSTSDVNSCAAFYMLTFINESWHESP